jgi:hypothetical protein
MVKFISVIIFLFLLLNLYSCGSSNVLVGTYRSKFAVHGFFGTTIRLSQDSTFQYVFKGDLMYDSSTGRYQVHRDKVYLTFGKVVSDVNTMPYTNTSNMPVKEVVASGDTIHYQRFFYIRRNKLFPHTWRQERK